MDKGLKLINDLKLELEKLELQQLDNQENLKEKKELQKGINLEVGKLNSNLNNLTAYKNCINKTPEMLKERKRETIKSMIEIVLVCTCITLLVNIINSIASSSFVLVETLKWLGITFSISSIFTSIFGIIMYNDIKKDYNFGNLQNLEKEIDETNKKLEISKCKQKGINLEVKGLEDIKNNLQKQINDILKKISSIEDVRTKVIDDFCKDNISLDNLLNKAYDEQIENKVKQKIK